MFCLRALDDKDLPDAEDLSRYRFILAESILASSQYRNNMNSMTIKWQKVENFYGDWCQSDYSIGGSTKSSFFGNDCKHSFFHLSIGIPKNIIEYQNALSLFVFFSDIFKDTFLDIELILNITIIFSFCIVCEVPKRFWKSSFYSYNFSFSVTTLSLALRVVFRPLIWFIAFHFWDEFWLVVTLIYLFHFKCNISFLFLLGCFWLNWSCWC